MASRGTTALLLATPILLWGTTYRGTAIGTSYAPPLVFGALRSVPAALVVLAVLAVRRPRDVRRRAVVVGGITGLLMVAFWIFAISEGVDRAGAANAAVLVNSATLWVALLSRLFLGERLVARALFGVFVGFAGIVVMFSSELHLSGDSQVLSGMAIALAGGAAWGVGTVLVKWLSYREESLDAMTLAGLQYAVGCPLLVLVAFGAKGTEGTDWSSAAMWGAVAYVGIGAIAGTICYFLALRVMDATKVASAILLTPVIAVAIEIARGEVPTAVTFVGMAVTVVGVALVTLPAQSRPALVEEPVLPRS
jgi:drug/metabolite transporter (DMT)-like permease